MNLQPIRHDRFFKGLTDRVWQVDHRTRIADNAGKPGFGDRQPVDHRLGKPGFAPGFNIDAVRRQNSLARLPEPFRHPVKRQVFLLSRSLRQQPRSRFCPFPDIR